MSGHLIGCVKPIKTLPTSHKLALVAFADSADDRTHIGFPGYEGVQEWAGVSRGRAAELIRDLVEWGLLRQHKRGHRGQRAEYVVFPNGCCDYHRTPATEPDVDVEQLARAAGISIDQARLMLTAMGSNAPAPKAPANGSSTPDASSVNASSTPDPIADEQPENAPEGTDDAAKGPERVSESRVNADAFTPSETSPNPAGKPAGSCAAHPNGHANCRDCGTSPRARREREKRAAAAAARAANQARLEQERQAAATRRASEDTKSAAAAAARAAIAAKRLEETR